MEVPSISLSNVLVRRSVWTTLERLNEFYFRPLLYIALVVWLVFNVFHTVGRVVSYYTPLPMWDYWRVVENLEDYKTLHLGVFWRQHNEHRIIFPELVFAFDMLFLHGRLVLPLVTSFLCYLVTWAILSSTVLFDRALTRTEQFFSVCLAGIMALWEGSANVLAIPFLLQWTLMQVAVAATFLGLSRLPRQSSNRALAGTVAAAAVATFSSGNALVLWPLVLGVTLLLRLKKRQIAILLASAVVNLSLYFVGYRFSSSL